MPEDLDLLAEIAEDPQAERIAAVLADCDKVPAPDPDRLHAGTDCWRIHASCWATRIRATLTGEDRHA